VSATENTLHVRGAEEMRERARHALESRTDDAVHEWESVLRVVEEWVAGKGASA
jgi:hypothetical protein